MSWGSLARITAWILIGYIGYLLWDEIMIFILACFLAVAANPLLNRAKKMRGLVIASIAVLEGLALLAFFFYIFPPLVDQISHLLSRLPVILQKTLSHLPDNSIVRTQGMLLAEKSMGVVGNIETWLPTAAIAGKQIINILALILLLYVFQVYLMIDGRRIFLWFTTFFSDEHKNKFEQTAQEMEPVISSYILGQFVTSVLCSIFVYALLSILDVPAAITIAVLAGIFDILPIVGFFMSAIPAILFAITVSPGTALIVFIAYTAYHLFEAYMLAPWIYGRRLEMSGLAVIGALIIGATVGGVLGAIIILPIAASFPIIERIWLKKLLGKQTVDAHQKISN